MFREIDRVLQVLQACGHADVKWTGTNWRTFKDLCDILTLPKYCTGRRITT